MHRKTDKGIIREYLKECTVFAGEPVTLKIYKQMVDGDPTTGLAKTFEYTYIKDFAVITAINLTDVMLSGGLYIQGDIKVQLTRELQMTDDKTDSPGDRILWKGNEYRPVGKPSISYLESYIIYDYTFRRI